MLDAHAGIAALAVHSIAAPYRTRAIIRAVDAKTMAASGAADKDDVVSAHWTGRCRWFVKGVLQ